MQDLIILKILHKDKHTCIDLDNGETLKIPYELAVSLKLENGKKINSTEYRHLSDESSRFMCKQKAFSYLAIRSRSAFELDKYLCKKGFSGEIIQETISRCKELGYLNDLDYSAHYIKTRLAKKSIGPNLLRRELSLRGISRENIKKAIKITGTGKADIDTVYSVALKKYNSIKDKKNVKSRLFFFLQQRGFDSDIAARAIEKLLYDDEN